MSEAEATRLAEEFVRETGYTDAPAAVRPANVAIESLEFESDPERRLQQRRGTLPSRACGVRLNESYYASGPPVWMVMFCYNHKDVQPSGEDQGTRTGRVVMVDPTGKGIWIQHQDMVWVSPPMHESPSTESAAPPPSTPAAASRR